MRITLKIETPNAAGFHCVHVETGLALPATPEQIQKACDRIGKKLAELSGLNDGKKKD